jgi:hypothetical protein
MNSTTLPSSGKSAATTVASARSKSKKSTIMKEQHANITEKMEGGILVRRDGGLKIEM